MNFSCHRKTPKRLCSNRWRTSARHANEILVIAVGTVDSQDVHAHLQISDWQDLASAVEQVCKYLREQEVIPDYCI